VTLAVPPAGGVTLQVNDETEGGFTKAKVTSKGLGPVSGFEPVAGVEPDVVDVATRLRLGHNDCVGPQEKVTTTVAPWAGIVSGLVFAGEVEGVQVGPLFGIWTVGTRKYTVWPVVKAKEGIWAVPATPHDCCTLVPEHDAKEVGETHASQLIVDGRPDSVKLRTGSLVAAMPTRVWNGEALPWGASATWP
jgi:hypothetical protein